MELTSEGRWAVAASGVRCQAGCRDPSPWEGAGSGADKQQLGAQPGWPGAVSEVCEGWLHRARLLLCSGCPHTAPFLCMFQALEYLHVGSASPA